MSYDLLVKRCFNLDDHSEHSWQCKGELHKCPGMPIRSMENLTEARCAVEGCGHLKEDHIYEEGARWCRLCFVGHAFVLAAAHVKQEKAAPPMGNCDADHRYPAPMMEGQKPQHPHIKTSTCINWTDKETK